MSIRKIVRISLTSRLIVFLFQLLFNCLLADHNADAFKGLHIEKTNQSNALERFVYNCLDGLNKWDARYFITISQFGYQQAHWIAFFPLYPLLVRFAGSVLQPFLDFQYPTANFLGAFLINLAAFAISCIALYKLTVCLFNEKLFAINTVKWFAYNPASIFFSASYTESLYSALLFTAIWLLFQRFARIQREHNFVLILSTGGNNAGDGVDGGVTGRRTRDCSRRTVLAKQSDSFEIEQANDQNSDKYVKLFSHEWNSGLVHKLMNEKFKFLLAIVLLTLASFTRSNGIVNVGFVWYLFLLEQFRPIAHAPKKLLVKLFTARNLLTLLAMCAASCLVISPFFIVQYVHHSRLCDSPGQASSHDTAIYRLMMIPANQMESKPTMIDELCDVPFWRLYSYLQAKHWSVGLFKYYQLRKVPNFLLATPMLSLVIFILKYFIESSKSRSNLIKSGLGGQYWNRTALLFPFIVHLLFLTLFSLFFINIEVLTRLLCSSSPVVFWSVCKLSRRQQNYAKLFFAIYFFVGTFAFSNFLPWT